jgi:hypothetical protein
VTQNDRYKAERRAGTRANKSENFMEAGESFAAVPKFA